MKGLLKFITCGSVDDGKSTLIGHILYDSKLLYADQERALELESKVGSRNGEIDYALLLDGLMAEREQGITIDVAYRYFTTEKRSFIVADTPGHEEYTRNMAVGASFADLAVILVDASQGVLTQTKRHARICQLMGIRYFIFAVNKMDLIAFSETEFHKIQKQIEELSSSLELANIQIIPLSATEGDNVTTLSPNMKWYSGKPLLTALEEIDISKDSEWGFYMPVQRVSRPDADFRGFQGQIESGAVQIGDRLTVLPSGEHAAVKTILVAGKEQPQAVAGNPVTITLDREIDISRGCVLTRETKLAVYQRLTVSLLWMDDTPLTIGSEFLVKIGTKTVSGILKTLHYKVDVNTGLHRPAFSLDKNETATVELFLNEPVTASLFSKHKTLGELILIDRITNHTSACGVVTALNDRVDNSKKASFQYQNLLARGDIFEEFAYDTSSLNILKYQPITRTYTIGDKIPTQGKSYHYPSNFDILILRDAVAVQIRDNHVKKIQPITEYQYQNFPVVNGRGFGVEVHSQENVKQFLSEYDKLNGDLQVFSEKWFHFDSYRKVIFSNL